MLRGIPDLLALFFIVPAAAVLIAAAEPGAATAGAIVYSICLTFLFAVSSTYHVPMWPLRVRSWLRRADHSAIYMLIAGTYTPVCLRLFAPSIGIPMLWVIWVVATAGILKSMFWPNSPRALNSLVYIVIGCIVVPFAPALWAATDPVFIGLFAGGGALYIIGAVIYTKRWLNFWPAVFGYHEVFHLFVIAAAACHFGAMWGTVV